ncbi:MAG: hypothetical protein AAGF12_10035 [Myxococcota bacterium]
MSEEPSADKPAGLDQELRGEVEQLRSENESLRARLAKLEAQAQRKSEAKARLMKGGWRLFIPLLDRQRVVRSFGKLVETAGDFGGPQEGWPTRERIVADARDFLESCVRFTIRRRTALLLFSLLATTIPAIQIWLVVQQNEIIENQSKFFEIQVYDIVARSMTEGDRNARVMTGALLANADLNFLEGVIEETFDPDLAGSRLPTSVSASRLRLEDAAFRGHLIRSVVRGVTVRSDEDLDELHETARPMLRHVLNDAADRVPEVLRLSGEDANSDPELDEQVASYFAHVGHALRVHGRLSRSVDEMDDYHADITPLLRRLSGRRSIAGSRFSEVLQVALRDFLVEQAVEPELGDPPPDLEDADLTEAQAVAQGLASLRESLGNDALNWSILAAHAGAQ